MPRPYLALLTLLAFSAYTLFTLLQAQQSLLQFGVQLLSQPDTAQVVIDLYLMAALACIWMVNDSRSRGGAWLGVVPYLLITAVFVSAGPLLYIALRNRRP